MKATTTAQPIVGNIDMRIRLTAVAISILLLQGVNICVALSPAKEVLYVWTSLLGRCGWAA